MVGDGALLVEPGDRDGLAAALARVLDGGGDIDALRPAAGERSAGFTWEACAEGLADLYRQAVPGARRCLTGQPVRAGVSRPVPRGRRRGFR